MRQSPLFSSSVFNFVRQKAHYLRDQINHAERKSLPEQPRCRLFILTCITDDFIIGIGGKPVHDGIKHGKHEQADSGCRRKQDDIAEIKHKQQLADNWERKTHMGRGKDERKEKYSEQLRIDAFSYFSLCHTDLLHDGKPRLILVPFRNLLIVNNQHGGQKEYKAENNAKVEQRAE